MTEKKHTTEELLKLLEEADKKATEIQKQKSQQRAPANKDFERVEIISFLKEFVEREKTPSTFQTSSTDKNNKKHIFKTHCDERKGLKVSILNQAIEAIGGRKINNSTSSKLSSEIGKMNAALKQHGIIVRSGQDKGNTIKVLTNIGETFEVEKPNKGE